MNFHQNQIHLYSQGQSSCTGDAFQNLGTAEHNILGVKISSGYQSESVIPNHL